MSSNDAVTPSSNAPGGPQDKAATPAPWSPSERQTVAFTKAVLTFKDGLDHARDRKSQVAVHETAGPMPETKQPLADVEEKAGMPMTPTYPNTTERYNRRIRILRAIQHGLTSVVSIVIAVLQSLTYIKYQQTKDVPGAWPEKPTLGPTLLLLAVAVMALMFDISSLVAYLMPGKRIADKAFRLAMKLHYWITTIKSLSYVVAASVCRAGFSMGGNNDLWGWSCSSTAEKMDHVNDAKFNCTGNTVAWILSLINLAIELLGVVITNLMTKRDRKDDQAAPPGSNAASNPNPTNNDSASSPLLVRNSQLDSLGDDVDGQLGGLGPTTKA